MAYPSTPASHADVRSRPVAATGGLTPPAAPGGLTGSVPAGGRNLVSPSGLPLERGTAEAQEAAARRQYYAEVPKHVGLGTLRSPLDWQISLLFMPALIAGLLEPVQQTAESILVGKLGVSQLGALGLGTVLYQFSVGFFACLIFATTPRVAAHSDDKRLASRATAHGMWIALVVGLLLQAAVWAKAPAVVTYMAGDDATLASHALLYLRARSWGLPAALIMMVAIGAARGVKDMNTPLLGSLAYLLALVAADALFLYGLPGLGIQGAGYGASLAQWVGAATVCILLNRQQLFSLADLASLPGPDAVRPYVGMTGSLAVNNLSALLPTLVATTAATSLGVQHLGAHTILRQLAGFWMQLFLAFNATAHSLIANSLSRQREQAAAQILVRVAQLAVAVSLPLAVGLYFFRSLLPGLFTDDVLVQGEVADVLPLLLLLVPLDALGTVLEGGILGASDTGYLGARTAASCAVSLLVLGAASATHGTLLSVWLGMKCVNVCALALDLAKFRSRSSPRSPPSKHSE
ncbi:hypothetical protein D9Q98_000654 [Chlorella vulgaris]|uniref:Protein DETOXIFICATION n=1 Tax=Chlorella vulgaris TaxID=3077 RepID=A0A9D4Z247_CHLVU|nr:hypothetical protein D9Q98_000654 [Chlorella vulgaris]